MEKEDSNIRNLRNSIYSKLSKITEPEKKQNIEDLESNYIDSEYEFNEDVLREEISYITDTKNISILYVDNETTNLNSFFSSLRHDFNIFLAHNTDLALDILKKEKIDILITDQKMPKLTGMEFLTKIKTTFKKTPTFIILSAHADTDMLIEAINNLHIFKFLNKPFNVEEIKKCIMEAYTYNLNK